jgi:hypothetical protein
LHESYEYLILRSRPAHGVVEHRYHALTYE